MITSLNTIPPKISVGFLLLLYCFSLNAFDGFTPPPVMEDICNHPQSNEQSAQSCKVPAPVRKCVVVTSTLVVSALAARRYFNRALDLLRKEMNAHFGKVHQRFDRVDTQLKDIGNNVKEVNKNIDITRQGLTASLTAHSKAHQEAISKSEQHVTETITDARTAIEKKLDALTHQRHS